MSVAVKYVEKIKSMTADELFDKFDDFCQLNQDLPQKLRKIDKLNKPSSLNFDLLQIFKMLGSDETPFTSPKKVYSQTTATKESVDCPNYKHSAKFCFSDFSEKSDEDSPKRMKYVDDSENDQTNQKPEIVQGAESKFKLEKPNLSNEDDGTSLKDVHGNNFQIKTKYDFSRRKQNVHQKNNQDKNQKYYAKLCQSFSPDISPKNMQTNKNSKLFKIRGHSPIGKATDLFKINKPSLSTDNYIKTNKPSLSIDIYNRAKKTTNYNILNKKNQQKGDINVKNLDLHINVKNLDLHKIELLAKKSPMLKLDIKTPKIKKGFNFDPNFMSNCSIFNKTFHSFHKKMKTAAQPTNLTKRETPKINQEGPFSSFILPKEKTDKLNIPMPMLYTQTIELIQTKNFKKKGFKQNNDIRQHLSGLMDNQNKFQSMGKNVNR